MGSYQIDILRPREWGRCRNATRDHLRSIREVLDSTGAVVARYDYSPFGVRSEIGTGTLDCEFGYTGHFHHEDSALVLTYFRGYDAELGRWLSPDPIGEAGGMNLYEYVQNDPVDLWDPAGLAWETTQTQGWHYNDRTSKFGFKLDADADGRLCATPLGGTHTFDQTRADKELAKVMADKGMMEKFHKEVTKAYDNPSFRDKDYLSRIGKGFRTAKKLAGPIAMVAGLPGLTKMAENACKKMKAGESLSDSEKLAFLFALEESGVPGRGAIAAAFADSHLFR